MWKKILVLLFVFFSTASVIYSICNIDLEANSGLIRSGGSIYGRIAQAPDGISGDNIGFKKGDKVYMGPIGWVLLSYDKGYTDYISPVDATTVTYGKPLDGWFVLATESIGSVIPVEANSAYNKKTTDNYAHVGYTDSNIYKKKMEFEAQLNDYFLPCDLSEKRNILLTKNHISARMIYAYAVPGEKLLIPELHHSMSLQSTELTYSKGLTNDDYSFSTDYWAQFNDNTSSMKRPYSWKYLTKAGAPMIFQNVPTKKPAKAVRPGAFLDLSKAVFAVSEGTDSASISDVTEFEYSSGPLWTATFDKPHLKVRMENDSLTSSTLFNQIENVNQNPISKAIKDSTVYLDASALSGSGTGGEYTVSVIVFGENSEFLYYIPLEAAKGAAKYEFDLSGIPVGKYNIGIVNEEYDPSNTNPSESSKIIGVKPLEIIEPLSLTVTAKTGLVINKNVNLNDVVATISKRGGVDPIQYTLISDTSVSGHENDYLEFDISNGNVIIKNPNGLIAKDYYFKINAIDANGAPTGGVNSATVHIVVGKASLTVSFNEPNQTKISINDAANAWNETATANPSTGAKITYSVSGGDTYLIDINPDTGAITYNGNGAYGKVKIKATADDDPNSGNDNYNSAFTEKEIIIYQEVDGHVTPDSNSSDSTIPTFTASDANIKVNGIIGTITGTKGSPNPIEGTTTKYTYGLKAGVGDANFFSVDSNTGVIKTTANLGVKSYSITVTVSDSWSTKEIPVTINVGVAAAENLKFYENSTSNTIITSKSAKATDTGVSVYATVKGSSNTNPVTYKIKDGSTNVITVNPNSGAVTIHGVGTVIIVAEKQGASGQADASTELTFTVTAGSQNFIYTDATLSNELPKNGSIYKAYSEIYAPNKTFQLYTAGNPTGSSVTYQLKSGSPSDVISVDSNGLVTILNASLTNQIGKVIVQATSHDPSGNYDDKTIELPINIEKATRVISFAENPIYVTNGNGKVTPVTEVDGVTDTDGDILIEVDSNEDHTIAWTNDNKTIDYNYSGETGKDIKIHATKPMDRNYKAAEADGMIHIMGPDENILAITSPGQIIYGDHFTIRSSQYDADSSNVQYTFEVDGTTYISNPTVNGNSAEFDALKYSGTNKTTITVTRTADGEVPLSKKVQVTVLPKPIEIIIDDKEKYKGEANPTLTYQDFRSELVSWNGVQDVIQENDIKLSTTANTNSNAGSYSIKGDANSLNKTYPNYSFTFKEGTLNIKEENVEDDWYHLELDDGNSTAYTGGWTNQNVDIISDHAEYIHLSLDQSTWNPNQVTITKEGETNQGFWMKKDSGAITKEKQEIIRIDKTAPKVKGIKAKDTNNKLQDIINKLSGGIFFKPGTAFEITTDDSKDNLKVSGTKEIAYKVYKVTDGSETEIKNGTLTVTKEKASITISETTGTYKVCVTPTDNAGNTNSESCHEVELKKIDVDVDGDGKPDFNDPDGDGCPDLNIKWKDPNDESKWIVINGDRNYDGIPDLNIDSDGDGKPDLNIDTDNDGKPDLNLVILKKSDWKPNKCVKADPDNGILEEYCTGTSVKAVINIDTDNDGVPNINIDNKGDFKPHINISKDGKNPIINIATIHEWKPEINKTANGFIFDTMAIDEKKDVYLNIDTDGDGRPDVNIDLDDDGKPDLNVDTDFDWIPNINIDSTGDGKPNVNVDTDSDGKADKNIVEIKEWKPNKNVDGDMPYDTMDLKEPSEVDEPIVQGDKTDVKGSYYPGDNVGGAMTGNSASPYPYVLLCGITSLLLVLQAIRIKK